MVKAKIRRTVAFVAFVALMLAAPPEARAQFSGQNIALHSWLDLGDLSASSGCDCWGYTSPSGREYALMGVNNKLAVVEITDPSNPVIVGSVSHSFSAWCDIKTYGAYAYVVNEASGGLDVVDLSNVDGGVVTLVQRFTGGGLSTSHNVAINTDSGYLYLIGSNLNGGAPIAYDLTNPANPVEAGRWTEPTAAYHHDAHIVTYTDGPYAGKEILFGFSEGRGLDIVDVTNKSNMTLLARKSYTGVRYCHQGWTSPDRRYLYVDDELDEGASTPTTRTIIFDISDLSNPTVVNYHNHGTSRDHNLYVRGCVMYQANYSSGVEMFNLSNPEAPVQIGYFDTFPDNDNVNFDGAWSVYPYFPSQTVIVSDIDRGLFVLDVSSALALSDTLGGVAFNYPEGLPESIEPVGAETVGIELAGVCGAAVEPGSGTFHYDVGGGFVDVPMTETSPDVYETTFPTAVCGQEIFYYFSAMTSNGAVVTDPADAPAATYSVHVASGTTSVFQDDFEVSRGWGVMDVSEGGSAVDGTWDRGVPAGAADRADPPSCYGGAGQCYLTDNVAGNSDVDNGTTILTSPPFDLAAGGAISYAYWLNDISTGPLGAEDSLDVEVATNAAGTNWVLVRSYGSALDEWRTDTIAVPQDVSASATMRIRFLASDFSPGNVLEAGVDDVRVYTEFCNPQTPDLNRDGNVDLLDFALLQLCHTGPGACPCVPPVYAGGGGPSCAVADIDLDGDVDVADYEQFEAALAGP